MPGTLYIVPTPIGNLQDITLRAIETLKRVDLIAAEDTRRTGLLLHRLGFKKPLISYQEHNETQRIPEVIQRLNQGQSVALVSDAGTPLLSDPGYKLIRQAIQANLPVDVLPGPAAPMVALVGSGLPTDQWYFGGFLPRTSTKRQNYFQLVAQIPATLTYFESPHRLAGALADAKTVLGNRKVVVAIELTKMYQSYWRGSLAEAIDQFKNQTIKGEIVLVIEGLTRQTSKEE